MCSRETKGGTLAVAFALAFGLASPPALAEEATDAAPASSEQPPKKLQLEQSLKALTNLGRLGREFQDGIAALTGGSPAGSVAASTELRYRPRLTARLGDAVKLVVHPELVAGSRSPIYAAVPAQAARLYRPLDRYSLFSKSYASGFAATETFMTQLDQLYVEYSDPLFQASAGRQPLSFGSTYIWNPLDLLSSFSPLAVDTEFKPGSESVQIYLPLADAAELKLAWALNTVPRANELSAIAAPLPGLADVQSLLASSKFLVQTVEIEALAGKVLTDGVAGLSLATDSHGFDLRAEALYTQPRLVGSRAVRDYWSSSATEEKPFAQLVAGTGYRFKNQLHVLGEYYFNGYGVGQADYGGRLSDLRYLFGRLYQWNRHYLGLGLQYPLTPLLQGSLFGIWNIVDGSTRTALQLSYSISENVECQLGLFAATGSSHFALRIGPNGQPAMELGSEFGAIQPLTAFTQLKAYF